MYTLFDTMPAHVYHTRSHRFERHPLDRMFTFVAGLLLLSAIPTLFIFAIKVGFFLLRTFAWLFLCAKAFDILCATTGLTSCSQTFCCPFSSRQRCFTSKAEAAAAKWTGKTKDVATTTQSSRRPLCPTVHLFGVRPAFDTTASPDAYTVTIAAPGLKTSDLNVVVEGDRLRVRGETKVADTITARLDRTIALPPNADASAATAGHEDGILTLTLPKKVPARKIKVTATSASAAVGPPPASPVVALAASADAQEAKAGEEHNQHPVGPTNSGDAAGDDGEVTITPRLLRRSEASSAEPKEDGCWDEDVDEWDEVSGWKVNRE